MFPNLTDLFKPASIGFEKDWSDFRMYAIRRHGNQMYGDMPYAFHLAKVECVLAEFGFTEYHYQAAAWLHDIVEDTDATHDNIYASYGPLVACLVYTVTGEGSNRKERAASIFAKIAKYPAGAIVKVADRIANMTEARVDLHKSNKDDKVKMYLKEWDDFRTNICPLMQDDLRSRLLWEALDTLVENCKLDVKALEESKLEDLELLEDEKKEGEAGSLSLQVEGLE
jgi:hypothetical protein